MSADPTAEEQKVQRFLDLAREDLRKTIETSLREVHQESYDAAGTHGLARTIARFASFLGVLSVHADKQTKRIVRLTWGLFGLTFVLFLATVALALFAYSTDKGLRKIYKIAKQQQAEKQKPASAPQKR